MQLDELRKRIAEEPERRVTYPAYRSREPLDVKRPGGVLLTEFLANREPTGETRTFLDDQDRIIMKGERLIFEVL